MLDYVPRGWARESCVASDAHLFTLQFHSSSFVAGWQGEMVPLFTMWHNIGRLSMLGFMMSLILIDALSSTCWEKRRKKNKEKEPGFFFPGLDTSCCLCHTGFSWLLCVIKG
jgi:hypothetical protein